MGTIADLLNTAMRDFVRYTGDGLPGEPVGRPLPVGDPASGQFNPPKKQVRDAFLAIAGSADDLTEAAEGAAADRVQTGLDRTATETSSAAAQNHKNQAQIAAIAAGAPLVATLTDPVPATDTVEILQTGPGAKVFQVVAGAWSFVGWLSRPEFDSVPSLQADISTSYGGNGTIVDAEGYRYEQDSTATVGFIENAGGVKLKRRDLLDREVTVGPSGEFSNQGEALTAMSNQPRGYIYPNADITLRLLTGYEMDEQVIVVNGLDLSYAKILSDDPVVNASRAALVQTTNTVDELQSVEPTSGFFMAGNGGKLPRIGCVFSMDTDGTENAIKAGMVLTRGAKGIIESGAGFWDTDGNGVTVMHGAKLIADYTEWRRNGRAKPSTPADLSAIRGSFKGDISATTTNILDSNDCGILVIGASIATVRDSTITNAARHGLYTGSVSPVHARGVTITGCGASGLYGTEGSNVRLIQSTITGNDANGVLLTAENTVVNSATGTVISDNGAFGVRLLGASRFSASSPEIDGNTAGGILNDGGDVFISAGSVKNNGGSGDDLTVQGGGVINLAGTVATTSGNTAAANVADSNVSAFNVHTSRGSAIVGRGGDAKNRGTTSIGSGSTSVVVTHGVDFSPLISEVAVTPTNSMNGASKFWISAMTATTFTINVDTDPGAGGASFAWNVHRISK